MERDDVGDFARRVERRRAAEQLLGKYVRFHTQTDEAAYLVLAITADGMVELDRFVGAFAPHLFAVASPPPA